MIFAYSPGAFTWSAFILGPISVSRTFSKMYFSQLVFSRYLYFQISVRFLFLSAPLTEESFTFLGFRISLQYPHSSTKQAQRWFQFAVPVPEGPREAAVLLLAFSAARFIFPIRSPDSARRNMGQVQLHSCHSQ